MKHLGVLICLALTASCGHGATRHRHETTSVQDEPEYRDEPDALDDSQFYQQRGTYDVEDSVAADNIKSVFGDTIRQTQRTQPTQGKSRPRAWSRPSSRTVVRRTQLHTRAQQPCAQAHAARPNPAYQQTPFPNYGSYPSLPWWPHFGGFPSFPVIYVPVPVCNCSSQENGNKGIVNRFGEPIEDDYDDIGPAPLDFIPASTPRPLSFKPPKVDHTPIEDDQQQEQESVPEQRPQTFRPPSAGGSNAKRPKEPRCARAIVSCCDLNSGVKCFEIFGCEGAYFGDPCSLYEKAVEVLDNYNNKISQ